MERMRWMIAALAACGSSGGGGPDTTDAAGSSNLTLSRDCPTPTSGGCGGTLDGTWTIATGCYPEPPVLTSCPELGWQIAGVVSGTIAFDTAAGTMTRTGTIASQTSSSAPTDCGCSDVDAFVTQQVSNAVCNDSADRCLCSGASMRAQDQTAHFTVAGTVITYDNAQTANFCAGAATLTLQSQLPNGDVFEVLTLTK